MSLELDHVIIAVDDLKAAMRDYRALGFTVVPGGIHANRATKNVLITFADTTYIELLAATGEPAVPGLVDFSALLQQGEGLAGFALRADDLDAEVARLRASGIAVGDAIPGERRRDDGTLIRWQLALLDGGFAPFLIQDGTPRHLRIPRDPALTQHPNRAQGLASIAITVRDPAAAVTRYAALFGAPRQRPSPAPHRIGCVTLRESPGQASPETLTALHITVERTGLPPFDRAAIQTLARADLVMTGPDNNAGHSAAV